MSQSFFLWLTICLIRHWSGRQTQRFCDILCLVDWVEFWRRFVSGLPLLSLVVKAIGAALKGGTMNRRPTDRLSRRAFFGRCGALGLVGLLGGLAAVIAAEPPQYG
jgi:heme A synthase